MVEIVLGFLVLDSASRIDDPLGQIVRTVGLGQNVLDLDLAIPPKVKQRVVHQLHPELGTRLDRRSDTERLVLSDQVGDTRSDDQDFISRTAASADLGDQGLSGHAEQARRELGANLILQISGEGIDQAVDGSLGAVGVQRSKHDVPSFRSADRR